MLQSILAGITAAGDVCRFALLAAVDWWTSGALGRALEEAYEPKDQGWNSDSRQTVSPSLSYEFASGKVSNPINPPVPNNARDSGLICKQGDE